MVMKHLPANYSVYTPMEILVSEDFPARDRLKLEKGVLRAWSLAFLIIDPATPIDSSQFNTKDFIWFGL